ncbi:ATP-binding protein [Candidatus Omnitrophota bacterium]
MKELIGRCEQRKTGQDQQYWWVYAMACCLCEQTFSRFGRKGLDQYLEKADKIAQQNNLADITFWVNKCKLDYLGFCGRKHQVQGLRNSVFSCLQRLPEPSTYEIYVLPVLAWEALNRGDFNSAQETANKLLDLAKKLGKFNLQIQAQVLMGKIALELNREGEALTNLKQAVSLGQDKQAEQLIPALYHTAEVLLKQGKIAEAREYLEQAQQKLETELEVSDSYYHIYLFRLWGQITQKEKQFKQAEEYFKQAIKIAQSTENPLEEGITQLKLGELYAELKDYSQSTKALEEASAKFIIIDNQFQLSLANQARQDLKDRQKEAPAPPGSAQQPSSVQTQQQGTLEEFMKLVVSNLDLEAVLNNVIEYIMKVTEADRGFLILLDEAGKLYSQVIRTKEKITKKQHTFFKNFSRTITKKVMETQEAILLTDVQGDSQFSTAKSVLDLDIRSVICVPLKRENKGIVGLIYIDRQSLVNAFTADDLSLVEALAEYASIALVNARMHSGVQKKLKTTEAQLIQSEKMATVGILAGGVAHEINTPLGAILLNTEMLLRKLQAKPYKRMLKQIEEGTQRCKEIVEMLLQYSRKTSSKFEPIQINQVIDRCCSFLEHQLTKEKIEFYLIKQQGTIAAIEGNFNELMQVFTNLIVNAKEAIKSVREAGAITIESYQEGNFVVVQVKDDGVGISKNQLDKIFDPFFTTKDIGQGTGLGLSIVYRIIENHKGSIEVSSKPQQGTTVTIKIPVKK